MVTVDPPIVVNFGWKQPKTDKVIPNGALPFSVSNVINKVELAGSGLVGKPTTVVSPSGELNVISLKPSGVITETISRTTLVIVLLAMETYSIIGGINETISIAIDA